MKSRVVPVTVIKKSVLDIQVIAERALNVIEEDILEELEIDELDIADHSTVIKDYNKLIKDITNYILTLVEEGE
jgi:hypothetical protein